ncbi:MAG: hypothetical protein LC104_14980 [Bacteroidales bacterium]|nr:hypothetical protein [Bacteroidales bacterium]
MPLVLNAIAVAYAVTRSYWPHLHKQFPYNDLAVGWTTLTGENKARDYSAMWLFFGVALAVVIGHRVLVRCLARYRGEEIGNSYAGFLWLCNLPALYQVGQVVIGVGTYGPLTETVTATVLFGLVSLGLLRWRRDLTGPEMNTIAGAVLCAAIIAGLGMAGGILSVFRLQPDWLGVISANRVNLWSARAVFAAGGAALLILATARSAPIAARRLCFLVLGLQAGLVLLYAAILPPPIVTADGIVAGRFRSTALLLVAIPALIGLVGLVRRGRALTRAAEIRLSDVLSPMCVAAVALFVATSSLDVPFLFQDDFHFGEKLIPFHQLWEFGKLPYRDFTPIFGASIIQGVTNFLFFSPDLETFHEASMVLNAALACALFVVVWWYAGPLAACLIGIYGATFISDRYMIWLPTVIGLAHPWLLSRPRYWLTAWLGLSLIGIAYNPTFGCAAILATAPVAVWCAVALGRTDRRAALRLAGVAVGIGAVALLTPPIREMAIGFVRFLSRQAATNAIAWGIPFGQSQGHPGSYGIFKTLDTYTAWETLRFGWMALAVALAYTVWVEVTASSGTRNPSRLVLAGTILASLLIVHGYLIGRIDQGNFFRNGSFTLLLVQVWVTIEVLRSRSGSSAFQAAALLAIVMGMMPLMPQVEPTTRAVADRVAMTRSAEGRSDIVPVSSDGLDSHNIGRMYALPVHLATLQEFNHEINCLLKPNETFLNLTLNSAWYVYTNRPVPTPYSSVAYASSDADQLAMVEAFRRERPPVAVLRPTSEFDNVACNLRCYRLFREVASQYPPIRRGQFLFLADSSRLTPSDPTDLASRIALLEEAYPETNLQRLPGVWGGSWNQLQSLFAAVAHLDDRRVINPECGCQPDRWNVPGMDAPCASYDLTSLHLSGADADFLRFHFHWVPKRAGLPIEGQFRVEFSTAEHPAWRVLTRFQSIGNRIQLVPLGSRPAWLLSTDITRIRVVLENPEECERFQVHQMELLHLQDGR